ncbi:MAG TPA: hypothetical protein VM581_03045 [Magnetospirillaceae bacterium]|nr:hypothetical protein [Magnetospirillaceae bacterium]
MGLFILSLILVGVVAGVTLGVRYVSDTSLGPTLALIISLALSVFIVWGVWGVCYRHEHWATCEVTGKDRGGEDGSYRVYTKDCDTLANEDSLFRAKWNSSNVWQQIEPGKKYEFRIVGSRIPFFSQFANILEVRPAAE